MTEHDAIVIGAGPSGTWVAEHLMQQSQDVVLIDGGPRITSKFVEDSLDAQTWSYQTLGSDCEWLRVRAVGGASLVWGGWCQRFPQQVFDDGEWPYGAAALAPYYDLVESTIGVSQLALNSLLSTRLSSIHLKVMPKQVALHRGKIWSATDLSASRHARCNIHALRIVHDGNSAIGVDVVDVHGERVSLRASSVIIAASPVETARLLLASDINNPNQAIGAGLTYHPVVGYALVHGGEPRPSTWSQSPPSAALVPRFVNCDQYTARGYCGGFSIEIDGPNRIDTLSPDLFNRIDPSGLLDPNARVTLIHGIGETMPIPERRVSLSETTRDRLGRPVPVIHCAWTDADRQLVNDAKNTCLKIAELLSSDDTDNIVQYLDPFTTPMLFHEAGTCRMGRQHDAPCDPWGKLRALHNVWIADASALPSAGDRHPTLTILAHAARVATSAAHFLTQRHAA